MTSCARCSSKEKKKNKGFFPPVIITGVRRYHSDASEHRSFALEATYVRWTAASDILFFALFSRSFNWRFNNSAEIVQVDSHRYTSQGNVSVLSYSPVTDQVRQRASRQSRVQRTGELMVA